MVTKEPGRGAHGEDRIQQQAERGRSQAHGEDSPRGGRPWAGQSHHKGKLCVLQKPLLGPL